MMTLKIIKSVLLTRMPSWASGPYLMGSTNAHALVGLEYPVFGIYDRITLVH